MIEKKIPDAETRKRNVDRLRESNRQLELWGLQLEELTAMVEADLCRQRRERLMSKSSPPREPVEQ
ncbi:MAG: hypothetical protein SXA11_26310 [Cyanobacteriota bacterium]|nr:hypothetical protein [Cyanobacteriota bacterium]